MIIREVAKLRKGDIIYHQEKYRICRMRVVNIKKKKKNFKLIKASIEAVEERFPYQIVLLFSREDYIRHVFRTKEEAEQSLYHELSLMDGRVLSIRSRAFKRHHQAAADEECQYIREVYQRDLKQVQDIVEKVKLNKARRQHQLSLDLGI